HLSNEYGNAPVTMRSVHLARSAGGHAIEASSDAALTFSGSASVVIAQGQTVTSDVLDFAVGSQSKLALTVAFGDVPSDVTGHPGSRTTSYIATGNVASSASLSSPVSTAHWYFATGIDVVANSVGAAAVVT